jgi:hypothetical protein
MAHVMPHPRSTALVLSGAITLASGILAPASALAQTTSAQATVAQATVAQATVAQATSLCRITRSNAARFSTNDLGSDVVGIIPRGTLVTLEALPGSGSALVSVNLPAQHIGFVPVAALGPCPSAPTPPPATPTSQCRLVLAKVFPNRTTVNLRAKASADATLVGSVARGAAVYVVLEGNRVKSFNDGIFTWVQLDVAKTQSANAPGMFTLITATPPAEVWMFNTQQDVPGASNLGMCAPVR